MSKQQSLEILNDETVIEAAERTAPNEPEVKLMERGGGLVPDPAKAGYSGTEVCYDKKVAFDLADVRGLSKYIYIHDIHVTNPMAIDTVFWVNLKNHRHVMLRIEEATFTEIRGKLKRGSEVFYVYNSINEQPRARQYVKVNDDKWPTEAEIAKMDVEISKMPGQDTWVSRDRKTKAEKNVVHDELSTIDEEAVQETTEAEVPAGS